MVVGWYARVAHFSWQKINLFLWKISKNWTDYKHFLFFRKTILKFSVFMIPYKSREIPGVFYYILEKFIKKLKKIAQIENDNWKRHANSWNFGRKSTGICQKMKDHHVKNAFHRTGNNKQPVCKILRVWTKLKKNWKTFKKSEIVCSKSLLKIDSFHIFTKYFLDFWLLSESIYTSGR